MNLDQSDVVVAHLHGHITELLRHWTLPSASDSVAATG